MHYPDDPTYNTLFASVVAEPKDDTVRLVFADYLDEKASNVRGNPLKSPEGKEVDEGETLEEWAKFIRRQVGNEEEKTARSADLASKDRNAKRRAQRYFANKCRPEIETLKKYAEHWLASTKCVMCEGKAFLPLPTRVGIDRIIPLQRCPWCGGSGRSGTLFHSGLNIHWSRGFPEGLATQLHHFVGSSTVVGATKCLQCAGEGTTLIGVQGKARVSCSLCRGTGKTPVTTRWIGKLIQEWPITSLRLSNREPQVYRYVPPPGIGMSSRPKLRYDWNLEPSVGHDDITEDDEDLGMLLAQVHIDVFSVLLTRVRRLREENRKKGERDAVLDIIASYPSVPPTSTMGPYRDGWVGFPTQYSALQYMSDALREYAELVRDEKPIPNVMKWA